MGYHSPTFYLLFCFHFISVLCSSPSSPTHFAALFQFKTHFPINQSASKDCEYSYPKTTSWKKGTDCCLWDGVSCDNITGEVISLELSCSCLSGTFLSNTTFFLLSSLRRLDLSFNDFWKSKISSKFGYFPSLTHLNLSSSWFSGPIPYEISYLSNLVSLHLSYRPSIDLIDMSSIDPNSFVNLSYSLTSLSLLGCHLRGKVSDNIFKLSNIEYLSLDKNPKLTSKFPKSNWSSPLVGFSASKASSSGELPKLFGNLKSLMGLALLCRNLTHLELLVLSYNYFSGNVPSSLANLAKLIILSLGDNQLEGCIPNNANVFPNLRYLDLSDNLLSGTTPSWLYTIPLLRSLDLGNNQFIGHISEFQNRALSAIILKDNSFHGLIPSCSIKVLGEPPPAPWTNSHEDGVVAIGYGFGFIFGLAMGCGCLRTGKPK
ncbi:hypothetical protein GOBAR_DD12253 [Gossypium barbadense]|nr:hypothetical protein GOBAR_DD12253 [Gossypium barbadense]